jgi:hypothetical protein
MSHLTKKSYQLLLLQNTETSAFALLEYLVTNNNVSVMHPYMKEVCSLIFRRLMENKTPQFCRLTVHAIFLISAVYGGQFLFETLESIQADMTNLIVSKIFGTNLENVILLDANKVKQVLVCSFMFSL